MSLTLSLLSDTVLSQPKSATIFSPPDSAFADSGQPSLSLLRFHFSPLAFSADSLRSLPFGTKIPTMSTGGFLTVTTSPSDDRITLNGVEISGSPIFDDGLLIVFGIEDFFDPSFKVSLQLASPGSNQSCVVSGEESKISSGDHSFRDASGVLKSRGYAVMASFLDLQLLGFVAKPKLTMFAPVDEVLVYESGSFPDYPSLFLRHVLPCKMSWVDLVDIGNETLVETYLGGYTINVTITDAVLMVNGVPITFPDMYYSDWLVIHGIPEILLIHETAEDNREGEFFDELPSNKDSIAPDRGEF